MVVHKEFIEKAEIDKAIVCRLMPGDDLFKGLINIAKDQAVKRGVIISAIGALKDVVFVNVRPGAPIPVGKEDMIEISETGPFELLSLEGNFFPSLESGNPVIHLHVILGTSSGTVTGGHLLKATVFTTAEIVLGSLSGSSVFKSMSDVTQRLELLKKQE